MPLVSRTFDQLIDFTRTSAATYVDASGRIVQTPASRNLLLMTQEFDNGAWVKNDTTITANATTAPDGTLTADKLIENTVFAEHNAAQSATVAAGSVTLSCYVKAAERSFFAFRENINGSFVNTFFNLTTGVVVSTGAGRTSSITSVGNGWYRCAVTATSTGGSVSCGLDISDSGTAVVYAGTTGSGLFLWGAQLEAASTATDYTRNNGGVYPPRFDYDPVTLAPKGLLIEEQRTNLLLRSEEFDNAVWGKTGITVSANATTSPDGTADADKLVEAAGAGTHEIGQSPAISSGTTYTYSVYVKAAERTWAVVQLHASIWAYINLSNGAVGNTSGSPTITVTNAGNGWYRVTVTAAVVAATATNTVYIASANGTVSYTGDGTSGVFLWGAQLEAGDFATSYIPTVASQVTRTADVATITGANFSQWYNQSEGTVVCEVLRSDQSGGSRGAWSINGGTTANGMDYRPYGENNVVVVGDVGQVDIYPGGGSANSIVKNAFAYKANDFAASTNGGAVVTDTSGSLPAATRLVIGGLSADVAQILCGHVRSIRYYPTRLSNAQLQALTA